MAKTKESVTLKRSGDKKISISIEHALSLLRLQKSKGRKDWQIADDKWKFENNEIIRRTVNKSSKKSESK